jgi:hypothetical protein
MVGSSCVDRKPAARQLKSISPLPNDERYVVPAAKNSGCAGFIRKGASSQDLIYRFIQNSCTRLPGD